VHGCLLLALGPVVGREARERVDADQAAPDGEGEDALQGLQVVLDRRAAERSNWPLGVDRVESFPLEVAYEAGDCVCVDGCDLLRAEARE